MEIRLAASMLLHLVPLFSLPSAAAAAGGYVRERSYMGEDFFSNFWFWEWPDLTHGHVDFVDEKTAWANRLLSASEEKVYMSADRESVTNGEKRESIKIFSHDVFNEGLFVISLDHMPTGCGTWPAFWMTGGNSKEQWPSWGEYDIIEGTHLTSQVATTLHTSEGCDQSALVASQDFQGTWQMGAKGGPADDCYVKADDQWLNQGCSQSGPEDSMGPGFNARGGGTFAAQWAPVTDGDGYFRTWFWPNGTEPADLLAGQPNPDSWGLPYSRYDLSASCPPQHFKDMHLVFDLTFCGDMADANYAQACPKQAAMMTCKELVSNHPEELQEAYWSIRRLETYQWKAVEPKPTPLPLPLEEPVQAAVPTAAPASCAAYGCGGGFNASQSCQCDEACLSDGTCCSDAASVCGVRETVVPLVFDDALVGSLGSEQGYLRGQGPASFSREDTADSPAEFAASPAEAADEEEGKADFHVSCSAHPACAHLEGDCCPTMEGMMLGCCSVKFEATSREDVRAGELAFMRRFQVLSLAFPRSGDGSMPAAGVAVLAAGLGLAVTMARVLAMRWRPAAHRQATVYAQMDSAEPESLSIGELRNPVMTSP